MSTPKKGFITRLNTAGIVVALICGLFAGSLEGARRTEDPSAMSCCKSRARCCCHPSAAEGHAAKDFAATDLPALKARCPASCNLPSILLRPPSSSADFGPARRVNLSALRFPLPEVRRTHYAWAALHPTIPRAPPLSLPL